MKTFFIMLFILAASGILYSQSSATSVSYNKETRPGLMLELPYSEEISENFIVDNLKKTGYDAETKGKLFWKQNKLNGYYIFKEVKLRGISEPVDLYFKVDQKGRKSKNESIIYMLVARGETFISMLSDEEAFEAAKDFLNGFTEQSAIYKLQLDIEEQEDILKDAEKKMDKLQDNEKDMLKKIAQLEKDLKKNKEDQEEQKKLIEKEKEKLSDLRSDLKKAE